jgi:hypothetical protein
MNRSQSMPHVGCTAMLRTAELSWRWWKGARIPLARSNPSRDRLPLWNRSSTGPLRGFAGGSGSLSSPSALRPFGHSYVLQGQSATTWAAAVAPFPPRPLSAHCPAPMLCGRLNSLPPLDGGPAGVGISPVHAARHSPSPRWGRIRVGVRMRRMSPHPSLPPQGGKGLYLPLSGEGGGGSARRRRLDTDRPPIPPSSAKGKGKHAFRTDQVPNGIGLPRGGNAGPRFGHKLLRC